VTKQRVWAVIVVILAVFAIAGPVKMIRESTEDEKATTAAGTEVSMAGLKFSPSTLVVKAGDQILFINDDVAPHTVTADDGSIDSGLLSPGQSFTVTADKQFDYHCDVHPSMTASIQFEGQ
jgi:plastocyanin